MSPPIQPPPPPPRSQRSLHYFELPSDLKWSSKRRSAKNNSRGHGVAKSSSSSKQKSISTNVSVAVSGQSTLEKSDIVDWLHGNLIKPPSASSSWGSSSLHPNINTTTYSDSNSSIQRTSSPFRFKIKIPNSTKEVQSSFSSWHVPESAISSRGTCWSPRVHAKQMDSSSFNMFPSRFATGDINKGNVKDNIIENFEGKMSILDTHTKKGEEKHNSEQDRKRSKDGKPMKTNVHNFKKTHKRVEENRKKIQIPDEEYKSIDVLDRDKFDAINDNNWNFGTRKLHKKSQILNLEKNVVSPAKDQERSAQENKDEKEIRLPKFSLQLTPQEIADDLFAMTGRRPSRKPKKRTKNVQRQVEELTPGLWLESIDADRYKVNKNIREARSAKNNSREHRVAKSSSSSKQKSVSTNVSLAVSGQSTLEKYDIVD
ncbi:hypothetical protein ACH5RR_000421 [Cinchona calisaya]|uniref:Uncharacterized protein n=1 Tax=Cinchona calisaya TaxID=153742 RepID=A0ABD3B0K3_9GENT